MSASSCARSICFLDMQSEKSQYRIRPKYTACTIKVIRPKYDARKRAIHLAESFCIAVILWSQAVRFYLSVSGRSLTALEGLGPSTQKTKTERRRRDFVAKTLQNVRVSMHSGHPSNSATIPSLHRPTRPTRPVDHPTGRPAHHLPPLGPTLGTRPDGL